MLPYLALFLWLILIVCLFRYDPAKDRRFAKALWVPLIWMILLGSRSASQWLGDTTTLEEGNSIDHVVYLTLTVLALAILSARHLNWRNVTAFNSTLALLVLFSLLSVMWADFPTVAFRRWIREAGNYVMVLVVLSEPDPLKAVEAMLRRLSYFLISLSVVFIKYFPSGVMYDAWTGRQHFVGVTGGKNSLGLVCLIAGLFLFWDLLRRWSNRRAPNVKRIIFVDIVFVAMTLWLLNLAESATSRLCLVIGCLVVALVHYGSSSVRQNVARTLPIAGCLALALEFTFGLSDAIASVMGRDPTLTGRTEIWATLLDVKTNPLLGVGFSSFWLGDRMFSLWQQTHLIGLVNAHNGYLETYLELGIVGLCILSGFLLVSYRTTCRRLTSSVEFASLSLALWTILVIYNVTESAFRGNPLWVTFLLVAIVVPVSSTKRNPNKREATQIAVAGTRRLARPTLRSRVEQ